jgi:uncharacterized damage-inducible protein DinB
MEITSVSSFLPYWEVIRERTRRVVGVIPDASMEWRCAPGRFSPGDLVRHVAAFERFTFVENALGRPSDYPGHGPELAEGPEAVRRFFEESHAESVALVSGLDDADLQLRCTTPAGVSIPKWKWLRAMVEHEVHHRGQLYLLLGMLGVETPPVFGMTSEEVRSRSVGVISREPPRGARPQIRHSDGSGGQIAKGHA